MSIKSRNFLILIASGIAVVILLALAMVLAYSAGRNSVQIDDSEDELALLASDSAADNANELLEPTQTGVPLELQPSEESSVQDPPTLTPEPTLRSKVVTETIDIVPVELDSDDLDLMLEVWDFIDENYDGTLPSDKEVTFGAIIGSLELLDDR